MTFERALLIFFIAAYAVVGWAYWRLRREIDADYRSFNDTFEAGAGVIEVAEQAIVATAAYGAFMQQLAFELVCQIEDPVRQQELLDGMSGARMQYLAMHPGGDTTDPESYMFRLDTPPPPLEI